MATLQRRERVLVSKGASYLGGNAFLEPDTKMSILPRREHVLASKSAFYLGGSTFLELETRLRGGPARPKGSRFGVILLQASPEGVVLRMRLPSSSGLPCSLTYTTRSK